MNISGIATLVSPMSGFSSSYDATALMDCGNQDVGDTPRSIATALPLAAADQGSDDGNGCWHVVVDADGDNTDDAGAPITAALMTQDRDLLTGRWMAISDENIMSHTKVVLTFPVNHLNYEGVDDDGDDAEGTDPVSILVFDDAGQLALEARDVMLGMDVNMCQFMPAGMNMGDDMMGDDMMGDDMMNGMPMLSCNGEMVGELDGMAGEFRIFNGVASTLANTAATDESTPFDNNPTNEPNYISGDGTETDNLSILNALDATTGEADDEPFGGQVPAESLNALGLVFSYFEGTDGNLYDQANGIQWISVPTLPANADTDADDRDNVLGL